MLDVKSFAVCGSVGRVCMNVFVGELSELRGSQEQTSNGGGVHELSPFRSVGAFGDPEKIQAKIKINWSFFANGKKAIKINR